MKRPIHLAGAHTSALDLEGSSDSLEEVTCESCREFALRVGAGYASARRNGTIRWIATEDVAASVQAFTVLEEENTRTGAFRRFDLKRWLGMTPGHYHVHLRLREGGRPIPTNGAGTGQTMARQAKVR